MAGSPTLSLLVPSLREQVFQVGRTVDALAEASRQAGLSLAEVILFDGGSPVPRLLKLRRLAHSLAETGPNVHLIGAGVRGRPNKNLAVAYAAKISSADILAVVDADFPEISPAAMLSFLLLLRERPDAFVLSQINLRVGRDNHLVGAPLLRCFWPKLASVVKQPFPGIYAGPTSAIRRVVDSSTYHFDWGGELDLLVGCSEQGLPVEVRATPVSARRHRNMASKTMDGYQMIRAGLIQAAPQLTGAWDPDEHIATIPSRFPVETKRFSSFAQHVLGVTGPNPVQSVARQLVSCGTPAAIHDWLITVSEGMARPEALVVASMVLGPLAFFLTGTELPMQRMPLVGQFDLRKLDIEGASLLTDILVSVLIATFPVRNACTFSSMLDGLAHPAFKFGTDSLALHRRKPTGFDLGTMPMRKLRLYASGHEGNVVTSGRKAHCAAIRAGRNGANGAIVQGAIGRR